MTPHKEEAAGVAFRVKLRRTSRARAVGFPNTRTPANERVLPWVICDVAQGPTRSAICFRRLTATLWRGNRIRRCTVWTGTMEEPLR